MRISMIGTGYVRLASGACIADVGHQVTCVDKEASKIDAINAGEIPIYEPGLQALVAASVRVGRLSGTTRLADGWRCRAAVFIASGTPTRRGDGHAGLSYVHGAACEIAAGVKAFTAISPKSTVP